MVLAMIYLCKLLKLKVHNLLFKKIFSNEFCDFLNKILKKEPNEWNNVIELIKHCFISNDLIDKCNFLDFLSNLFDYMSIDQWKLNIIN